MRTYTHLGSDNTRNKIAATTSMIVMDFSTFSASVKFRRVLLSKDMSPLDIISRR